MLFQFLFSFVLSKIESNSSVLAVHIVLSNSCCLCLVTNSKKVDIYIYIYILNRHIHTVMGMVINSVFFLTSINIVYRICECL